MKLAWRLVTKLAAVVCIAFGLMGLGVEFREGENREFVILGFSAAAIFLAYGIALCVLIVRRRTDFGMILGLAAAAFCLISIAAQCEYRLKSQRFGPRGVTLIMISGLTAGLLLFRARPESDQR